MDTALPAAQRPPAWIWILPRVALLLSLAAVVALVWLLYRSDLEEQRDTLIADVLWVEQDLRFHLERNVEQLRLLGLERVSSQIDERSYELRARHILGNGQGLVQLVFVDAGGEARSILPPQSAERMVGEAIGVFPSPDTFRLVPSPDTFRLAQKLGTPQYSGTYPVVGQDAQFEIQVPLYYGNEFAGVMVGVYSLRTLLAQFVPWWFAEKYKLNVVDDNATVLASKSNIVAGQPIDSYQVAFDPRPEPAGARLPQRAPAAAPAAGGDHRAAVDRHRG